LPFGLEKYLRLSTTSTRPPGSVQVHSAINGIDLSDMILAR
jgi:hypothetical protein